MSSLQRTEHPHVSGPPSVEFAFGRERVRIEHHPDHGRLLSWTGVGGASVHDGRRLAACLWAAIEELDPPTRDDDEPDGDFYGHALVETILHEHVGPSLSERILRALRGSIDRPQVDMPHPGTPAQPGPSTPRKTSRAAALANFPRSGGQRLRVLQAAARFMNPDDEGCTRDQLVQATEMPPNVLSPRVLELLQGGWLEVDSAGRTRKTRSGVDAEVLRVTTRGMYELHRRRL